jgi:hypothetical protein
VSGVDRIFGHYRHGGIARGSDATSRAMASFRRQNEAIEFGGRLQHRPTFRRKSLPDGIVSVSNRVTEFGGLLHPFDTR